MTRLRFLLPPELSDGQSESVDTNKRAILNAVSNWLDAADAGESVTIEAVEMTDAEFDALPEL